MDKTTPYWWPELQSVVAISLVTTYICVVILLILRPITITGEAGTLLTAMTGLLTGKVATIVDFYFGTSKSSALKDEAVKTQSQTISDMSTPHTTSKVEVTATETTKEK